VSMRIHGRR